MNEPVSQPFLRSARWSPAAPPRHPHRLLAARSFACGALVGAPRGSTLYQCDSPSRGACCFSIVRHRYAAPRFTCSPGRGWRAWSGAVWGVARLFRPATPRVRPSASLSPTRRAAARARAHAPLACFVGFMGVGSNIHMRVRDDIRTRVHDRGTFRRRFSFEATFFSKTTLFAPRKAPRLVHLRNPHALRVTQASCERRWTK